MCACACVPLPTPPSVGNPGEPVSDDVASVLNTTMIYEDGGLPSSPFPGGCGVGVALFIVLLSAHSPCTYTTARGMHTLDSSCPCAACWHEQ